jgi:small subunit ribosomal protein S18|tara:strand:+ start:1994 stop:2515 length:522 start_codon:yes stop_codon:yes gene_type:complete
MPPTKKRKGMKPAHDARRGKPKVSILTQEKIEYIDWKDVNLLRRFVSDRAKIRARRVTGNSAQQQRDVAMAIKNAREMALLPYKNLITTQRGGRGGDRRNRDDNRPSKDDRPPRKDPEPTQEQNEAPSENEELINVEVPQQPEMETSAPEAVDTLNEAEVDTPNEAMKEETPE